MQPLVQLITAWQQYTEQFADVDVEDFCYQYLLNNRKQHKNAGYSYLLLAKQLGKTNSILKTYLNWPCGKYQALSWTGIIFGRHRGAGTS
jgi:hypothetical protein